MARALVVDDEPFLILLARDELEQEDFEVRHAFNAEEALAILSQDRDWDLLLTDIRMPGAVDGLELGRTALLLAPELHVIYASGYTGPIDGLSDREYFLEKPYETADLRKILQKFGLRSE